jgi:glycine/D-amino acid oxidase-like deaminating enzyme
MTDSLFDIAIIGSGPVGAATAYFLSQKAKGKKIILITQDPTEERTSTYHFAGGSVQYGWWKEPVKIEMTGQTAEFIHKLTKEGVDLSLIEDGYLFLDEGVTALSLNISGVKLVDYLVKVASKNGVTLQRETTVEGLKKEDGAYQINTNKGNFLASKVLLAVGPNIKKLLPEAPVKLEKRQLFVLDLPVNKERERLPHTIIPINDGWAYFFIKKIGDQYKLIVGQEELFEHNDEWEPEDYFDKLMETGLGEVAPFLRGAKVEKILWGFDSFKKTLEIYTQDEQLFSINCGSAVRACVYIGQKAADRLLS